MLLELILLHHAEWIRHDVMVGVAPKVLQQEAIFLEVWMIGASMSLVVGSHESGDELGASRPRATSRTPHSGPAAACVDDGEDLIPALSSIDPSGCHKRVFFRRL
jgi:hypothetical protein